VEIVAGVKGRAPEVVALGAFPEKKNLRRRQWAWPGGVPGKNASVGVVGGGASGVLGDIGVAGNGHAKTSPRQMPNKAGGVTGAIWPTSTGMSSLRRWRG